MPLHIKKEVAKDEVPVEFIRLAFAHLESSEKLNSLMSAGTWTSSFQKGRVVHWLAFHATELFLKGCILQTSPGSSFKGHSLASLLKKLKKLRPDINFRVPFSIEALPPYPALVAQAEEREKTIH